MAYRPRRGTTRMRPLIHPRTPTGEAGAVPGQETWDIAGHQKLIQKTSPSISEGAAYYKAWTEGSYGYDIRKARLAIAEQARAAWKSQAGRRADGLQGRDLPGVTYDNAELITVWNHVQNIGGAKEADKEAIIAHLSNIGIPTVTQGSCPKICQRIAQWEIVHGPKRNGTYTMPREVTRWIGLTTNIVAITEREFAQRLGEALANRARDATEEGAADETSAASD